ncbi:Zn-dependent peptidase ImmA (M78 family)/DNA-binding XRE family transcriptional regulator [Paenarthrobacter nicotinovorans]|uniref:helix-turn-helix domain-containing protein n=1 Tax=Micrococcaceae TaxID=1268 RepID=UPI000876CC5B|nr:MULTISPECIES: XRE family transcriptional regulator [Micrococcaceae]MDR6434991.1 Zn-dependent peptidase ImmA (M78 family)/DNA-binding XRE family transcriptional regulator [Paenarthrobacter nicotinovorans]SCZ59150.1 Zn-dependent peptidase ImmA, M78 family [Arthrobacter sp. UNCCL28]
MLQEQRGKRLVTLRRLVGLSQTELASATGISQPQISLMERGDRSVSDSAAAQIAAATKMPLSFFDQMQPSFSGALSFRKLAGASAISRDSSIARFEELERVAAELCSRTKYRLASLPQAEDDIDGDDIEILAAQTRAALKLEPQDPILNLTRSMERRGIIVAAVGSVDEGLLDGHDGASRASERIERPIIAYVSGKPGDRQRFTEAHELGHIVLHGLRPDVGEKIREREAHRFAGALLIPQEAMQESVSEALALNGYLTLKATWGVSIQAIVARAHALGLISDSRRKSLMVQISYKGWRKAEPVDVRPERPLLLRQMLVKEFGESPYLKASWALGASPRFLQEWAPGATTPSEVTPGNASQTANSNVVPLFSGAGSLQKELGGNPITTALGAEQPAHLP